MTGYGKAEAELRAGKLTIEIRSLNAKTADISVKSSLLPKDKELLIREKLARTLVRGTIDVYLSFEANASEKAVEINGDLIKEYYSQLAGICSEVGASSEGIMPAILRFPDILESKKAEAVAEDEWHLVESAFDRAISALDDYRIKEGAALYADVSARVRNILELEKEVEAHEDERLASVKESLLKALEEAEMKQDKSRFEQEMIFYLQKFDINEEKVRLRQHCKYFTDTLDGEPEAGKKLGFIIQEMGREINTTGSKANNAGIQKAVVLMKDELEKIREQSLNIL